MIVKCDSNEEQQRDNKFSLHVPDSEEPVAIFM